MLIVWMVVLSRSSSTDDTYVIKKEEDGDSQQRNEKRGLLQESGLKHSEEESTTEGEESTLSQGSEHNQDEASSWEDFDLAQMPAGPSRSTIKREEGDEGVQAGVSALIRASGEQKLIRMYLHSLPARNPRTPFQQTEGQTALASRLHRRRTLRVVQLHPRQKEIEVLCVPCKPLQCNSKCSMHFVGVNEMRGGCTEDSFRVGELRRASFSFSARPSVLDSV
jgi:hypothetical protein